MVPRKKDFPSLNPDVISGGEDFFMDMKIIILKIGSSVLLTKRNKLDEFRIAHFARQIKFLKGKNYSIVLVVSGAVACGMDLISADQRDNNFRQLAAGIGQAYLTSVFHQIFSKKHLHLAQILLTKEVFQLPDKSKKISCLFRSYLRLGVIPFVNENDAVDLNSFGGNDFLAKELIISLGASQLLILSTMAGSVFGVGGGETKQKVLSVLEGMNIKADIVDGKTQNIILKSII